MASAAWRTMMRALPEARQTAQDAAADGGELAKALVDMWAAGLSIGWAWAPLAVGCVCVLLAALGPRGSGRKPLRWQQVVKTHSGMLPQSRTLEGLDHAGER